MKTIYPITQISDGSQPAIHGYFDICPESPDGKHVAYTRLPPDGQGPYQVTVATRDGREHRAVGPQTTGNYHSGARPQWSDAATVIFAIRGSSKPETACVNISDGRVRRVPGAIRMYSPANRLGVTSSHEARILGMPIEESVLLMDMDKGTLHKVLDVEAVQAVHPLADRIEPDIVQFKHTKWSPDGRWFSVVFHNVDVPAFRERPTDPSERLKSIFLVKADGSEIRYMTEFGHHPAWHPSGDAIVTGEILPDTGAGLLLHPLQGGEPTIFVRNTGSHTSISPDGRSVVTDCFRKPEPGRGTVEVIDVETGRAEVLAEFAMPDLPHERRCHPHPTWSRDGKRVYFNCAESGIAQLYAVDLE